MATTSARIYDIPSRRHMQAPAGAFDHTNVGTMERVVSIMGGVLLTAFGLQRSSYVGYAMAAAGGAFLFRGVTGYCPALGVLGVDHSDKTTHDTTAHIKESVTIDRPRDELYAFWRDVEKLPAFMHHIKAVHHIDATHSEWQARVPKGLGVITWKSAIVEDRPGELIAWRSIPGADIHNAGEVRFLDAPAGRGTEIHVNIEYRPPAGDVGALAARLINPVFSQLVREDVRRFKRLMETGQIPTSNEGKPRGA